MFYIFCLRHIQEHAQVKYSKGWFTSYAVTSITGHDIYTRGSLRRQGYVYVLDSEGAAREGWPVQMGDVQAQVAVADIDSDGRMCALRHPPRSSVGAAAACRPARGACCGL